MLCRPARSKMFVADEKRPALISVTHGTPRAFSRKSMLKTPEAFGSSARTARRQTSTTRGSKTVFARAAIEDTSAGWPPVPRYERRSYVLMRTRRPPFQRLWQPKSRPGRYSESVKDEALMVRKALQKPIQLRACAEVVTEIAPRDPLPRRMRHQARDRPATRRKIPSMRRSLVTA